MIDLQTITESVRIAAPPADVFPYLIDPTRIVEWIGDRADLNPVPAGMFALDFGELEVRGTYVVIEPPHRVVFTWGVEGSAELPAGSSTVEIVLTADGGDTVLELNHRDLPPDEVSKHRAGWTSLLKVLQGRAAQT